MGFDLSALSELQEKLELAGDVGKKIENNSIKEAAKIMLDSQLRFAPENTGKAKKGLKIGNIKRFKSGSSYVQVGLDKSNWEQCKGLWYQNFNGIHSSGKHVGWMKKAYENAKGECTEVMTKAIMEELEKIF